MKRIFFITLGGYLISFFFTNNLMGNGSTTDQQFVDQVNLAIRQVGHQLLSISGDSTSTVPPVDVFSPLEYRLRLEHKFDYDTLPALLHQAFANYEIPNAYHVTIKSCANNTVILGFQSLDYSQGEVACRGREQWEDCNYITIKLHAEEESIAANIAWWFGLGLPALLGLIGFYLFRKKQPVEGDKTVENRSSTIKLGIFQYDPKNQVLSTKDAQHNLTFRENKLLHFLSSHPNEVLPRERILEEVWGDEGVIVGRSLDVFISRLRKLIKADTSLKIKNVHGVGYRLELKPL